MTSNFDNPDVCTEDNPCGACDYCRYPRGANYDDVTVDLPTETMREVCDGKLK